MSTLLRSPQINSQSRLLNVDNPKYETVKTGEDQVVEDNSIVSERIEKTDGSNQDTVEALMKSSSLQEENQPLAESHNDLKNESSETELEQLKLELKELKASIEEKYRIAEKQGYDDGYKNGLQDSDKVLMDKLESFEVLKNSISDAIEKNLADNEDLLVEIVFTSLCKVFGELAQTKEGVIGVVRQTASQLVKRDKLMIRVPAKDYEIIREEKARLSLPEDSDTIELVPDTHLKYGGCIVETTGGGLDGRLEIQLKKLMDTLLNTRAQKSTEQNEADA